eukprot:CAMPEP_0194390794 /NCGR_PEP_ID=MMETSP0174-20130528/112080_1 /TAXON_ID=216777 /ORGANISM="Proboscia alata, Strain PI-D3" /LENGTH=55 /DNA_ID=CAMNT_0039184523 /DNA_START=197 /DNA_END=361 /DNA_ORIENTATION=-
MPTSKTALVAVVVLLSHPSTVALPVPPPPSAAVYFPSLPSILCSIVEGGDDIQNR